MPIILDSTAPTITGLHHNLSLNLDKMSKKAGTTSKTGRMEQINQLLTATCLKEKSLDPAVSLNLDSLVYSHLLTPLMILLVHPQLS